MAGLLRAFRKKTPEQMGRELIAVVMQRPIDCDVKKALGIIGSGDVNLDAENKYGETALLWAAGRGHIDCVKAMIAAGANLDKKCNQGDTALIAAAGGGHVDCVKALLAAGARLNEKNNKGDTALVAADVYGNTETVQILEDAVSKAAAEAEREFIEDTNFHKGLSKAIPATKPLIKKPT